MKARPKPPRTIEYNPRFEGHGYKHVRWVENASRGLRLVGFADEIAKKEGCWRSIQHTGWYTDDYGCFETYRGIVYQLPKGRGYVYGYDDPNNKDCALLCFDPEHDKMDAANAADDFAKAFAEAERDYNRAWQAGRRAENLEEQITETRKRALAIGSEMRAARGAVEPARLATICATLRAEIMSLYRLIQKMRKERAELIDNFGEQPGFADG